MATKKAAKKNVTRKAHVEQVTHKPASEHNAPAPALHKVRSAAKKKAGRKPRPLSVDDRLGRLESGYTALVQKLRRHGVNVTGLEVEEPTEE